MTANTARQADGRFLHAILMVLIVATLGSGAVAVLSISQSEVRAQTGAVSEP